MRLPQVQINPTSRIASTLHILYRVLLPLIVLSLVRVEFVTAAFVVIALSKWRMFAVRPRYWAANIRANAVDMVVGFATVIFMARSSEPLTWLIWAGLYAVWLVFIKPRSSALMISVQALIAQALGLVAIFNNYMDWSPFIVVFFAWLICYTSAKHFLNAFEEPSIRSLSHIWALFGAELALILSRWHIVYLDFMPQIALLLTVIGYSAAIAYYIEKTRGLSTGARRQFVIIAVILIIAIIAFSKWQSETF